MSTVEPQVVKVRTHPADKVRATKERTPVLPFDTRWRPPGLDGIAKLTLRGNTLASMVGPRIVTARLDTSLDEPMTLTLELWDRERKLLTSGLLDTKLTLRLEHHTLVMTRVGKLGDLLHLEFEDGNVAALRKQTGPLKVTRGTTNRIDFVKKLLEEKGAPKLRWYIDSGQPGQVTVEKNPLALDNHQERKPGPLADTTIKNAKATPDQLDNLRVVLTHLFGRGASRDELICVVMAGTAESRWLNSATHFDGSSEGIFQQQNVHKKGSQWYGGGTDRIAAADLFYNALQTAIKNAPQLLSSEKHLLIQATQRSGTEDGSNYSPWLEESQKTVSAFDRAYGGSKSVMATALYEFRRGGLDGSPEDSWECLGRLADEVQYRRFIVEGVFYFLPDELLVGTGPRLVLHEKSDGMLTPIDFDMDEGVDPQTASFSIHTEQWYAPPGTCIELTDLGPGNGVWLVSKATSDLLQPNAQDITLIRPRAVLTEPPADQTLDLDASQGGGRSTPSRSLQSGQPVEIYDAPYNPGTVGYPLASKAVLGGGVAAHNSRAKGNWQSDNAVDLMIPYGTRVLAVDDGTIGNQIGAQASSDPLTAGLRLTLTTADNAWWYGHLSRIDVVPGQVVRKGQVLGLSGRAGPDHLHLGVEHGDPQDLIGQH